MCYSSQMPTAMVLPTRLSEDGAFDLRGQLTKQENSILRFVPRAGLWCRMLNSDISTTNPQGRRR